MVTRPEPKMQKRTASWVAVAGLSGLVAILLILIIASVLAIPSYLVHRDLGQSVTDLNPQELAKAKNDVRATLLQGIAGLLLVAGAVATWRQLRTSRDQLRLDREGQITDRFAKAIEQLGDTKLEVRLGGLYALERIANSSEVDRRAIIDVLTSYVRDHSPWPPKEVNPVVDKDSRPPPLRVRAADVQAAMTVLGREAVLAWGASSLDLDYVDLREAHLIGATLTGANLRRTNLRGAHLYKSQLDGAFLMHVDLRYAELDQADLRGAHLQAADLRETKNIHDAYLTGAGIDEATQWPHGFGKEDAIAAGALERGSPTLHTSSSITNVRR